MITFEVTYWLGVNEYKLLHTASVPTLFVKLHFGSSYKSVTSLFQIPSAPVLEQVRSRWSTLGFVVAGGHARVADMGLARWLTPESMGVLTGETGTYLYMSPEMIRHELYNSRTDVYSWGVLLVELISQRIPYEDQHLTPLQVCTLLLVTAAGYGWFPAV